jgi:hypothetical protein
MRRRRLPTQLKKDIRSFYSASWAVTNGAVLHCALGHMAAKSFYQSLLSPENLFVSFLSSPKPFFQSPANSNILRICPATFAPRWLAP